MPAKSPSSFVRPLLLGGHLVPGIWRHMLPYEIQILKYPAERRATCNDCPHVHEDGFRRDYRCCTYHPRVPNFLLGLAYRHDAKARRLLETVAQDGWFLPEGMQATAMQWADFLADVAEERFGRSELVLCPFLEKKSGRCGIYRFRNAVCSTFFCRHDHGRRGRDFWEDLQTMVSQVEIALAQWALVEIGFDFDGYIKRMNRLAPRIHKVHEPKTKFWRAEILEQIWGKDHGRELEVYAACAEAIERRADELWELANQWVIREAIPYEKATHEVVPNRYKDQIEDSYDDDEDDEAATPRELWGDVKRRYRKLWELPDRPLVLSPRARLSKNDGADPLSLHLAHKPRLVTYLKRPGGEPEWRIPVDEPVGKALAMFKKPCTLTSGTMTRIARLVPTPPEEFVAEWVGLKILIEVKEGRS